MTEIYQRNASNVNRGVLYGLIAFLTPYTKLFQDAAEAGVWPSALDLTSYGMAGLLAACITLRAFIDGSVERNKQKTP